MSVIDEKTSLRTHWLRVTELPDLPLGLVFFPTPPPNPPELVQEEIAIPEIAAKPNNCDKKFSAKLF
jgi:hypothetical protein